MEHEAQSLGRTWARGLCLWTCVAAHLGSERRHILDPLFFELLLVIPLGSVARSLSVWISSRGFIVTAKLSCLMLLSTPRATICAIMHAARGGSCVVCRGTSPTEVRF